MGGAGGGNERFRAETRSARRVCILVWSPEPAHYTLARVAPSPGEVDEANVEYYDSLRPGSESARTTAERSLRNLGLVEPCPKPINKPTQAEGWSCGLWAARFLERCVLEDRGEATSSPQATNSSRGPRAPRTPRRGRTTRRRARQSRRQAPRPSPNPLSSRLSRTSSRRLMRLKHARSACPPSSAAKGAVLALAEDTCHRRAYRG